MNWADRSIVARIDSEAWHPRYRTLVSVGVLHLIVAATLLSIVPVVPPIPPNVVEVVTVPSDADISSQLATPVLPVQSEQSRAEDAFPIPEAAIESIFGPKPADRRNSTPPIDEAEKAFIEQTPTLRPPIPPVPTPALIAAPVPDPTKALDREPVIIRAAPFTPALILPDADPLRIAGSKLDLKQAPSLKPPISKALPKPPTVSNVAPPKAVVSLQAPATPSEIMPKIAPLSLPTAQTPLPKVQVPRIAASVLRLPDVQTAQDVVPQTSTIQQTGVTSLSRGATAVTRIPSSGVPISGQTGGALPASPSVGPRANQANAAAGASPPNSNSTGSGGGNVGPTGILPRRPGGASVRQPFPTDDSSTVLGRMNKTYDCSRLNRERDARCPVWDPVEGRNSQGAVEFAIPTPKGLPKLRNPAGTNPMPVCLPGTPGSQMGLSCLPSREGPGIPKP